MDLLPVAKSKNSLYGIVPRMGNRHGLITGATGTGKTVTLQVLAEAFSRLGVPVFAADIKGDLSGISAPGKLSPKMQERLTLLGLPAPAFSACSVQFWDVFGNQGHPVRATISDMGPLLLNRILNLNDTQEAVLAVIFKIADDNGWLLLDLKDLRMLLQYVADNAAAYQSEYGNIAPVTVAAIQRNLLALEEQGGDKFFGEPSLRLEDLMRVDASGQGVVNVLSADKLMQTPRIYATFLLWLLSELFEQLPEVGDTEKPKLVFFFDEAHLLFTDAPKSLLEKIEQVVRLVRSKGVGVYFVTQNPLDIPETVLGQLGNRVQHALRAFTPRDQKAVKAAATTFRTNPELDTETVITELAVGEALVSFLDVKGAPTPVERAWILPPHAQIGPITAQERAQNIRASLAYGRYERNVDRESAYELLKSRTARNKEEQTRSAAEKRDTKGRPNGRQTATEAFMKSAARSIGTNLGSALLRGLLGSLSRKR